MVIVSDWKRIEAKEGSKPFNVLVLQSALELVKSKNGNWYATTFNCQVPSTFDEKTCRKMIGTKIPGNVVKVQVTPYPFVIKETGEKIMLDFSYQYQEASAEEAVFNREIITA